MFRFKIVHLLLAGCLFSSCSQALWNPPKTSAFLIDKNVKPGITKAELIAAHGDPYKQSFFYDDKKVLNEILYYKESLAVNQRWYNVNTIFHFENSILISQEQGKEEWQYSDHHESTK